LKRFRKASIECSGSSYAEVDFGYELGYGTTLISQPLSTNYAVPFSSVFWDSFTWDSFTWDGRSLYPTECEVLGTAENTQITIGSNSTDFKAYAINSVILHYTPRRGMR
jgi:hypothetical protein